MASQYTLFRGGHEIVIEKESDYFTAILPYDYQIEDVQKLSAVSEMKRVFGNIFKIKPIEDAVDEVMDRMRSNHRISHVVHHAYHPAGDASTRYYITDALVVSFVESTSTTRMQEIAEKHALHLIREYKGGNTFLFQVTEKSGKNPVKLSVDLSSYKEVAFAEPNLINRYQPAFTPTDQIFKNQWHLSAWDGFQLIKDADVKATQAWDYTRGKRDVVVAIIDDGFDLTHPDLRGENKIVGARDFSDGDLLPIPNRGRGDYHGTPCAGVAIGEINGEGIVGMAPGCAFMPIRFNLNADDNLLYDIFDYTSKKADVISCSWGPVPVYTPLSSLLFNQMTEITTTGGRRGKGCVVAFAAGNFNAPVVDVKNKSFWWRHPRNGMKQTKGPIRNGYASHPNVVCVSASTSLNEKAAYSNWGKEINVCAPSNNWHPTSPQTKLAGRNIWTADNDKYGVGYESGPYTGRFGGTSSATPVVAGIAALMISVNPHLSGDQIREILQSSSDRIVDKNPDIVLGHRKGTYDEDGHSEWFGYGKVNAFEAVRKALALKGQQKEEEQVTTEEPEMASPKGLKIIAAMINPKGNDFGKEYVLLINQSDVAIDLKGFSLIDHLQRKDTISGFIGGGSVLKFMLKRSRLTNTGGSLSLLDTDNQLMDKIEFTAKDANPESWLVTF